MQNLLSRPIELLSPSNTSRLWPRAARSPLRLCIAAGAFAGAFGATWLIFDLPELAYLFMGCLGVSLGSMWITLERTRQAWEATRGAAVQNRIERDETVSRARSQKTQARELRDRLERQSRDLAKAYLVLSEVTAKLGAAVEAVDAAFVIADVKGDVAFINTASGPILRSATPQTGENVAFALRSGDLGELATEFDTFLRLGARAQPIEIELAREGQRLESRILPLLGERGEFLGALLSVTDVTAQRDLDAARRELLGFVVHELRGPLSTVYGYLSLLQTHEDAITPEQKVQTMDAMARQCRRMNRLISDLLDSSRLESGAALALQVRPFEGNTLLEDLVNETRAGLNSHPPIEIALEMPSPLPMVADYDRIEQIISNLLSNAIKYSPQGGTITIAVTQNEEQTVLEVRDQGWGLTAEHISRLGTPFYRTEDAKTHGVKGNGLGLSLVRQLVEAHGGSLEIESERDKGGRGSTFRVRLPLKSG